MTYAFDTDTAVRRIGEGRFEATITDRWDIGSVPNGGYVMAVAMAAMGSVVPHPDPLTVTAHFLTPAAPGDAVIDVETIKAGRTLSTATARLRQDGRDRIVVLGTFGDLDGFEGPTEIVGGPPDLGPPGELVRTAVSSAVRLTSRFDYEMPAPMAAGLTGEPTGTATIVGRIRFADGRPPDLLSLPVVADGFPPTVFQLGHYGWTPTVELTVQLRARPRPGWLTCRVATRYLQNGLLEEDVDAWDVDGHLVALSRQLALAPSPQARAGMTSAAKSSIPDRS